MQLKLSKKFFTRVKKQIGQLCKTMIVGESSSTAIVLEHSLFGKYVYYNDPK